MEKESIFGNMRIIERSEFYCFLRDDTVLVADLKEKLRDMLLEFERVCQKKELKINPAKKKNYEN